MLPQKEPMLTNVAGEPIPVCACPPEVEPMDLDFSTKAAPRLPTKLKIPKTSDPDIEIISPVKPSPTTQGPVGTPGTFSHH